MLILFSDFFSERANPLAAGLAPPPTTIIIDYFDHWMKYNQIIDFMVGIAGSSCKSLKFNVLLCVTKLHQIYLGVESLEWLRKNQTGWNTWLWHDVEGGKYCEAF